MKRPEQPPRPFHIEVIVGGSPMAAERFARGLLRFGRSRPHWRLVARSPQFAMSAGWLRERGVDGVILWQAVEDAYQALEATGLPRVVVMPQGRPRELFPVVEVDDFAIGRLGARTFLERGFRHFAFCGSEGAWPGASGDLFPSERVASGEGTSSQPHFSDLRRDGFADELRQHGFGCETITLPLEVARQRALESAPVEQLKRWLENLPRPTALMCAEDLVAAAVIELAGRIPRSIPDDLAVLGVNNFEMTCELSPVSISSISPGFEAMAFRSCEVMEAVLNGNPPAAPRLIFPPKGVVLRHSTETMAHDDILVRRAISRIHEGACTGVQVKGLCRELNVNIRTLNRHFKAALGCGPKEAIQRHRLNAARNMLLRTSLPLSEIAVRSGYADQSHFSRHYRKVHGESPVQARKRSR